MRNKIVYILFVAALVVSCATKKEASGDGSAGLSSASRNASEAFVGSVIDNAVDAENIVGNATIRMKFGDKTVSVPGSLRMRKDNVIRLQLFIPILGTEIGRLEFTPDYVLVLDRINRQYIKGDYNQLDFLRENGISFYSLQSLFWNELISPGEKAAVPADARKYSANLNTANGQVPLVLDKGKMKYQWNADCENKKLTSAVITYNSASSGISMLSWLYSDFMVVGKKEFPATQEFSFHTNITGESQNGEIRISMSGIKTSSDWDAETVVSERYKKVTVEDVFKMLMSF